MPQIEADQTFLKRERKKNKVKRKKGKSSFSLSLNKRVRFILERQKYSTVSFVLVHTYLDPSAVRVGDFPSIYKKLLKYSYKQFSRLARHADLLPKCSLGVNVVSRTRLPSDISWAHLIQF